MEIDYFDIKPILNIPCSRYDFGESDPRVRMVLGYVWAQIKGTEGSRFFPHVIARLHDYKGELTVCLFASIPEPWREIFRTTWAEIGDEKPENVQFLAADSEDWADLWTGNRWESDWKPTIEL